MPDNDRLAKLIERRKRQEKQNDRIRVHKNELERMRLAKLCGFFDWNRNLLNREYLTAEAKCVRSLEMIYDRQCKIEDERKRAAIEKMKKEEEIKLRRRNSEGESPEEMESRERDRKRIMSANKQEQAKKFISKVKTLSSGYRDNDPPLSYYKKKGIVPPDRVVSPQLSSTAQAEQGGGFGVPASAMHLSKLKMKNRTPQATPITTAWTPAEPEEEVHSEVTEVSHKDKTENGIFEMLENGSTDENMSTKSSLTSDENDTSDVIKIKVVKVRPSTAPGERKKPMLGESGIVTELDENKTKENEQHGILVNKSSQRPATAAGVSFSVKNKDSATENNRLKMRRQSSAISFAEVPTDRRRSSGRAPPLALLHRRQSNVAQIHKSITQGSKLLKPKKNKMKKPTGSRMGLMQSVMTNAEQEILRKKMKQKSKCFEEERARRWLASAPSGRCHSYDDEDYRNYTSARILGAELLNEGLNLRGRRGQTSLLEANVKYSKNLDSKVQLFNRPQTRG